MSGASGVYLRIQEVVLQNKTNKFSNPHGIRALFGSLAIANPQRRTHPSKHDESGLGASAAPGGLGVSSAQGWQGEGTYAGTDSLRQQG